MYIVPRLFGFISTVSGTFPGVAPFLSVPEHTTWFVYLHIGLTACCHLPLGGSHDLDTWLEQLRCLDVTVILVDIFDIDVETSLKYQKLFVKTRRRGLASCHREAARGGKAHVPVNICIWDIRTVLSVGSDLFLLTGKLVLLIQKKI